MSKGRKGPETAQGLVGDAMKNIAGEAAAAAAAREREAERLEMRARRMRVAAGILLPACLALTVLNLSGFGPSAAGASQLSSADVSISALLLLSDAVEELEFSREESGRYPQEPGFFGPDGPGGEDEPFSYELLGADRYLLSVTLADETFSFDSREDPDTAFREVRDVP